MDDMQKLGEITGSISYEMSNNHVFVKTFPVFERLKKGQANGLVHAATQITTPDAVSGLGGSIITELGSVNYTTGQYSRQTYPIAVFANGRGISIKEMAAVQAGGFCRLIS